MSKRRHATRGNSFASVNTNWSINAAKAHSDLKKYIVVIDDDKTGRKLMTRGLERLGYTVHAAEDGKSGVEVVGRVLELMNRESRERRVLL